MKTAACAEGKHTFDCESAAQYSCERIRTILDTIGPRAPGSPEELKAQQLMAEDLKAWSDTVDLEEFTVHRQAFMGFIPFTVALGVAAGILYWFHYNWIALLLVLLAMVPLVLEFVMYRQFIDRLFPGHPSHNVIAARKPQKEVKRRIILIGHADSQYEWTLNYFLGGNGMKAILIPAVVGLIVTGVASLCKFLALDVAGFGGVIETIFAIIGIALFCFIPFELLFLLFQNPFRSVPGANDNLSGCLVGMSVLKNFEEAGVRFEHTEVVVILSGSEEAGLRGAKDYAKRHKAELLETETVVIGLDTFRDLDDLAIYDRDMSGTVRHDMQAKQLVYRAGVNCGLDLPFASIYIGACDAAAFTQMGIKSTGFAAMDPTPPRYYHTRLDTADMLKPEAIETGVRIMMEAVCLYDEEGLPAV